MPNEYFFVCAKSVVGPLYLSNGRYHEFFTLADHFATADAAHHAMMKHRHYNAKVWSSLDVA